MTKSALGKTVFHSGKMFSSPGQLSAINPSPIVEKILRHLGLWSGTPPLVPARAPPDTAARPWTREPIDDVDPMPNYENVLTD